MTKLFNWAQEVLADAGYAVANFDNPEQPCIIFENDSTMGFVLIYREPGALISSWRQASESIARLAQFALRRADTKAWNTYFVFLAEAPSTYGDRITIGAIEEDLIGTRKIARAGVASLEECRGALLPLLPIQNSPRLESVDMPAEIRMRASELPAELVEIFLAGASERTLVQMIEAS